MYYHPYTSKPASVKMSSCIRVITNKQDITKVELPVSGIAEGAIIHVNQTFTDPMTGEDTTNHYKMQYTNKGGWQVIDSDLPKAPLDDDTTLNDIKW